MPCRQVWWHESMLRGLAFIDTLAFPGAALHRLAGSHFTLIRSLDARKMQTNIPWRCACVFTALFSTADALRATRRQCCNFVAATAALAADKACAVDSNALEDAFSARTKVLRSVPCGNQPVRRVHVPSSRRRIDGVGVDG